MKEVLISIRPEWCELIAAGKKTVEVRKNKPKLKTPFKVYIYCTKDGDTNGYQIFVKPKNANQYKGICTGTVFGEFVCNRIDHLVHSGTCRQDKQLTILNSDLSYSQLTNEYLRKTYLTLEEIEAYSKGGDVYAWQISDLVIYDKPKPLHEFFILDKDEQKSCRYRDRYYVNPDLSNGAALLAGFTCSLGHEISFCRPFENLCLCFKSINRPPQSWCYVDRR